MDPNYPRQHHRHDPLVIGRVEPLSPNHDDAVIVALDLAEDVARWLAIVTATLAIMRGRRRLRAA